MKKFNAFSSKQKSVSFLILVLFLSTSFITPVTAQTPLCNSPVSASFSPTGNRLYDFDSDNKADLWLFNNGAWKIRLSSDGEVKNANFGTATDILVPEAYNFPSGTTNIAIWRPGDGNWWIFDRGAVHFGLNGDRPAPWDYDGDRISDLTVFRNGVWYILKSSDQTTLVQYWGQTGDKPVMGYFFGGDTKGDIAVFRPGNSTWYALNSVNGATKVQQFGAAGDQLVPADYDGDNITDFAISRPMGGGTNIWWIWRSSDDEIIAFDFGLETDYQVPADYDGDNKADYAVYRASNKTWYILKSTNCDLIQIIFGNTGDIPVQNILYR